MKEFLEIIYYVVQSIWPIFFLALVYLIWKDINRIAAHVAPEYYYDDDEEEDEESDDDEDDNLVDSEKEPMKVEQVKEKQDKKESSNSGKSPSDNEFVVEDLEL